MHVRSRRRQAAQGWRLEPAAVCFVVRYLITTGIKRRFIPADSGVVKTLVREIGTGVAAPATAAALVKPQTVPFIFIERLHVAGTKTIHPAIARQQHTLETGHRFGQIDRCHAVREDSAKQAWIFSMRLQAPNRFCDTGAHLQPVGNRMENLILQAAGTAVPEETLAEGPVQKRGGVALTRFAANTGGQSRRACKALLGLVAGGAGHAAVARKNWIKEQLPPQAHLRLGQGIVLRHGSLPIESKWNRIDRQGCRKGVPGQGRRKRSGAGFCGCRRQVTQQEKRDPHGNLPLREHIEKPIFRCRQTEGKRPAHAACLLGSILSLLFLGCQRPQPVSNPPSDDDPRLTYATPYRNVRPEIAYVGDAVCAACHLDEAESFRRHPMGRSLTPIATVAAGQRYDQMAHNPFTALGSSFAVESQGDHVFHKEVRRDRRGQALAETQAEIAYAIGSGTHARSYLINRDGYLFQSPITWFSQKARWDLSPSFDKRADRFERVVRPECLFCHCNHAEPVADTVNRYQKPVFQGEAIGCERCHGPGQLHVERRERGEAGGKRPDDTIVNPGRLAPGLREAVCQQCHLEGESRVLRRGRQTFDYRPGLPLQLFWSVFVRPPDQAESKVVSSVEQMYASRCFRESGGRLGCISCHDPHRLPAAEQRIDYYRER